MDAIPDGALILGVKLFLVVNVLLIIAAYLRVIFNLLTLINSSTLNLVFSFEEKSVAFEFIVLNRALSILFLNFRICNLLHK